MKALIIDVSRCNGCRRCEDACSGGNAGAGARQAAAAGAGAGRRAATAPSADARHSCIEVTDQIIGTASNVRVRHMINICRQCADAPCASACTAGALHKRPDGIIDIDPERCTGDGACLFACPYAALRYDSERDVVQKCTLCAGLLDQGLAQPRCVAVCAAGALLFDDEAGSAGLPDVAKALGLEKGTQPLVRYAGLPERRFVSGVVYDPDHKEVLQGATVTLVDRGVVCAASCVTDDYGDLWIEIPGPGRYELVIELEGYSPRRIAWIDGLTDVELGDVELHRVTADTCAAAAACQAVQHARAAR